MKHYEVGTLKEAQSVHQKYFDKTVGEYKALAKHRDVQKRKVMLAD